MFSSKGGGGGGWIMEKRAHLGETGGVQETGQSKFYHGGMNIINNFSKWFIFLLLCMFTLKAFCSKSPFLLFVMYPH